MQAKWRTYNVAKKSESANLDSAKRQNMVQEKLPQNASQVNGDAAKGTAKKVDLVHI